MTEDYDLSNNIGNFKNHPSIMKIEENINKSFKLFFIIVTRDEVEKEIKLLNMSKSQSFNDIL